MAKTASVQVSVSSLLEKFDASFNGVFNKHPEFMREMKEVQEYYKFYEGFKFGEKNEDYGQLWATPTNMDYEPTKEIRNLTKKLLNKQSRFMFGKAPKVVIKPFNGKADGDRAENKRAILDAIFDKSNFWSNAGKAFTDATIGKRVLLVGEANQGQDIRFMFYTMPEFMFQLDPRNPERLQEVQIVFQDERTKGKDTLEQIWHWYTYRMETKAQNAEQLAATLQPEQLEQLDPDEETCWVEYRMTNGEEQQLFSKASDPENYMTETQIVEIQDMDGNDIEIPLIRMEKYDTGLSMLPCYVILNEGLTGDTQGTSDVKDLMHIQRNLNKTISDYRDALRFRMFEQPVVIDGSSESLRNLKIAPNALIDLKTDTTMTVGSSGSKTQAKIQNLSGSYTFQSAAQYYLDGAKKEMYETMDQPLPEQVQSAPSGKAMQYLFYDLQARCDHKWRDWEPAVAWAIRFIEEAFSKMNGLQPSLPFENIQQTIATLTSVEVVPQYPIPQDEDEKRQTSIAEVQANVKSHRTHIKEFGMVEDENAEWSEIIDELAQLNEQSNTTFVPEVDTNTGGNENGEEDEQEDEDETIEAEE